MSSLDRASPKITVILNLETVLGARDFIEVSDTTNIVIISALGFDVGDATLGSVGVELSSLECVDRVRAIEGPVDFFEGGTTILVLAMITKMQDPKPYRVSGKKK